MLVQDLATSEPNDGSYDWVLDPGTYFPSVYAIRVTSVDEPSVSATSGEFYVVQLALRAPTAPQSVLKNLMSMTARLGGGLFDHPEHVVAVALELCRPDTLTPGERGEIGGLRPGDAAQVTVVEHDVGGDSLR